MVNFNPFEKYIDQELDEFVKKRSYDLETILIKTGIIDENKLDFDLFNGVGVASLNWDPFIGSTPDSIKKYQREFCWGLEDKQLLIESIYQKIDCGKILIRLRSYKEIQELISNGIKESLAFNDIVDGKQRLNAIYEFYHNKFRDKYGYLFSEYSITVQNSFMKTEPFSYLVLIENSPDRLILKQFLRMNTTGKQQSIEHIEKVKSFENNK
jgi:uncharacterized protein with ParB-like and HNH nuclease domain